MKYSGRSQSVVVLLALWLLPWQTYGLDLGPEDHKAGLSVGEKAKIAREMLKMAFASPSAKTWGCSKQVASSREGRASGCVMYVRVTGLRSFTVPKVQGVKLVCLSDKGLRRLSEDGIGFISISLLEDTTDVVTVRFGIMSAHGPDRSGIIESYRFRRKAGQWRGEVIKT